MQQPFLMKRDTIGGPARTVTGGDTSPKGRGKSTAGNFIIEPDTLATGFKSWLSL